MSFIADLHIHSRYSRATSRDMETFLASKTNGNSYSRYVSSQALYHREYQAAARGTAYMHPSVGLV